MKLTLSRASGGIGLPGDFVKRTLAGCDGLPYEMKSSMLQVLEHGRRLELPWLSGTIGRLGQELGTPIPSHCLHHHALELHAADRGGPGGRKSWRPHRESNPGFRLERAMS
jgi:ketopantoate reductase